MHIFYKEVKLTKVYKVPYFAAYFAARIVKKLQYVLLSLAHLATLLIIIPSPQRLFVKHLYTRLIPA